MGYPIRPIFLVWLGVEVRSLHCNKIRTCGQAEQGAAKRAGSGDIEYLKRGFLVLRHIQSDGNGFGDNKLAFEVEISYD